MKNLRIGTRLGSGFAAILLLLVVLATVGVQRLSTVGGNTELILVDRYAKVVLAHRIEKEVNQQALALRTALIATDVALVKNEVSRIEEADRKIGHAIDQLQAMSQPPDAQQALDALVLARKPYDGHKAKLVELVLAQSLDEGGVHLTQHMTPAQNAYLSAIDAFGKMQSDAMMHFGEEATQVARSARFTMMGLAIPAVLLGVAIAYFMTRSITLPILQAVAVAEKVAYGDLSSSIEVQRTDETGQLLLALQRMNTGLSEIVRQVRDSSVSIAAGAAQIASGNADLSRRTESQALSLQQTAAAMEEVNAMAGQSARKAGSAASLAEETRAAAMRGGVIVSAAVESMAEVAASARRIAAITGEIDEIALQTNILALNAAVEGARAAELGTGFSVVAAEVRTLSRRVAAAAKSIKTLIGASVEKTEEGAGLVGRAGEEMNGVVAHVGKVAQFIGEISSAAQEQNSGIGRVSDAVGALDKVTQHNVALVEESAAAAEILKDQSERLAAVVRSFKLKAPA